VPKATLAGVHRTPLLANAPLFDIVLKATSVLPPPLRGTSPERGRFTRLPLAGRQFHTFIAAKAPLA